MLPWHLFPVHPIDILNIGRRNMLLQFYEKSYTLSKYRRFLNSLRLQSEVLLNNYCSPPCTSVVLLTCAETLRGADLQFCSRPPLEPHLCFDPSISPLQTILLLNCFACLLNCWRNYFSLTTSRNVYRTSTCRRPGARDHRGLQGRREEDH